MAIVVFGIRIGGEGEGRRLEGRGRVISNIEN
jgi:hypothetical protein